MKNLKKIFSIVLTVVMICAFSTVAFAKNLNLEDQYAFTAKVSDTTIAPGETFDVEIYLTNTNDNTTIDFVKSVSLTAAFSFDGDLFELVEDSYAVGEGQTFTAADWNFTGADGNMILIDLSTAYSFDQTKPLGKCTLKAKAATSEVEPIAFMEDFLAISDSTCQNGVKIAAGSIDKITVATAPAGPSVSNAAATPAGTTLTIGGKTWTGLYVYNVSADVAGQATEVSCTLTANSGAKALGTHVVAGTVKDATVTFRAAIVNVPDGETVSLDTPVFSVQ